MKKLKVAVLFGGVSFEHEVSLSSAFSVISALKENFLVYPIGITKKGEWFYYFGDLKDIKTGLWEQKNNQKVTFSLSSKEKGILKVEENFKFSLMEVDCIFPLIHGQTGEDGKLLSCFELTKIPYVGCNYLSSALCMNKILTHIVLENFKIKMAPWKRLKRTDLNNSFDVLLKISEDLSYPIFTKPASCGSSVGVRKCNNFEEFKKGVLFALQYEDELICERYIKGKEVECGVLGEEKNAKASVVGQICSFGEFYDYDSKYKEDSKLIIPAKIKKNVENKIREISVKAFKIMGCFGLCRVDFFVDEYDKIYLNEINTMPGFTEISMYKKLWEKAGVSYKNLLKELVMLAVKREKI